MLTKKIYKIDLSKDNQMQDPAQLSLYYEKKLKTIIKKLLTILVIY